LTTGGSAPSRSTPFKRLGRFVHRRRKLVVVAGVLALVLLVPIIITVGNSTSLQQGSASGNQLESVKASNLISAQFSRTVANSTLLVVVKGSNVSSPATQVFVSKLMHSIASASNLKCLNQTADVYSPLYSAIIGVHDATYAAVHGANATAKLLLGVPALYLGAWQQAFMTTHNVTLANGAAFDYASRTLSAANATAYQFYTSHVLSLFNAAWASSWPDKTLATVSFNERASLAARTAGLQYLNTYTPSSKSFGAGLLSSLTLADYITGSTAQTDSKIAAFAQGYISNSTGFSQKFVNSAY
jgi:hypothetical protein